MATAELIESAVLTEASTLMSAGQDDTKGIWRTRIIEADVQGSSGYYPAEVLMRDGPSAFPAGTHVYLDHPTDDENSDRPERSVKDLAGYLVDGVRFEESVEDGRGLFARIQFIPELRERIKSLAPVIGLSIRAAGEVEEARGQRIVRSIAQGLSVDVVTRAGAGGRLVTMTESTKPESPPAEQAKPGAGDGTTIPSTSGTGALLSEVASMRTTLADQTEQLSIENTRVLNALKESQRLVQKLAEEHKAVRESVSSINERQSTVDSKMNESKQVGQVVAELIKSGLPVVSMVRIAENYRADQDIHAEIQRERDYNKKLVRESERGGMTERAEASGLGLTESVMGGDITSASTSPADFSEMDAVLSGKGW